VSKRLLIEVPIWDASAKVSDVKCGGTKSNAIRIASSL